MVSTVEEVVDVAQLTSPTTLPTIEDVTNVVPGAVQEEGASPGGPKSVQKEGGDEQLVEQPFLEKEKHDPILGGDKLEGESKETKQTAQIEEKRKKIWRLKRRQWRRPRGKIRLQRKRIRIRD